MENGKAGMTGKHTPGPWEVIITGRDCADVRGSRGQEIAFRVYEPNAHLIALAPEMAGYLSRMRCVYKAPEVSDEACGHCIVCRAKTVVDGGIQ